MNFQLKVDKFVLHKIFVCQLLKQKAEVDTHPNMALLLNTVRDNCCCIYYFSLIRMLGISKVLY